MKNKLNYSFNQDLRQRLQQPQFKTAWQKSETEYILAKKLIEIRLARKLSQRDLAKKVKTSQAAISRIETMQANPSLFFLKKLAQALEVKLQISLS
ncbi:MAG: helix-turn-helix transcriptional regulator [Patescibacteria group bacterium]|nr:helix-turn-helix transcriptional regulator [Patescibacteria group bacterium]